MANLPSGAVTFLFTDIEGSTRLVKQLRGGYGEVLEEHQRLLRAAFEGHDGHEVDTQGDSFFVAFASAREALLAAVEGERALLSHPWPDGVQIRARMGLHTGQAVASGGRYTGLAVHRAARVGAAAHGGQILVSQATQSMIEDEEEDLAISFRDLGDQRLKDIERPVRLYQVAAPGLPASFPPLRAGEGLPAVAARPAPFHRRRLVQAIAGAIALAIAATVAVASLAGGGGGGSAVTSSVLPDSLAVVDPKTSRISGDVRIPGGPSLVAAGGTFVWVVSDASRTISSISVDKQAVTHVVAPNDATPSALAADGDAVWVLDGNRRLLLKIDPAYGAVTRRIELPRAPPAPATNRRSSLSVATGAGALWVTDGSTRLLRVDPESGRVRALDVHEPLDDVALGAGAVWAISGQAASVFQIDTQARTVKPRISIVNRLGTTAPFPLAVTVGEGSVWVVNGNTQTVTEIDPELGGVTATIPLGIGRNPSGIAAGAGAVWVANGGNGTLARIDSDTNEVTTIPIGSSPTDVAVGGGRVWVTLRPGFIASISLPSSPVSGVGSRALPASFCSAVEYQGKGQPMYLIPSDMPFQGISSLAETLQMSDAIRFVLAQHHFRAGPYSVGYQSCDNSISQTGNYDVGKCRRNAIAYAANRSVIGVIGAYHSACAAAQLAVLAGTRGGPIAMIGLSATSVGLMHTGPGTSRGEPQMYYPHRVRNFARVIAADDLQGAANALLAKRLGVRRLYVLHDADPYGFGIASNVRHAATELGIAVAGFEGWDPQARTYTAIARKIQRSRADAVFLGGIAPDSNGAALVKSLRSVLGERFRILTPDGFTPIGPFAQLAGPAAEGVTVSFPATPPERLRGEGQRFVADFRKAVGRPVEAYSVVAAQATEVLLDAIARSDGSRASVREQLFKTKVSNGILGSFSFNRNGDTTAGAVTIYRIVGGSPRVLEVITPPLSLVP
jgi:class 3 adenylate cyclase/ABC-type branched-subunit amino acid transport system substrate-binding protein/streptogramin lyase